MHTNPWLTVFWHISGGGGQSARSMHTSPSRQTFPPCRPPPSKGRPPSQGRTPICEQTDACENITFPAPIRYAVDNKSLLFQGVSTSPDEHDRTPIKSYKWIVGTAVGASTSVALIVTLVLVFGVFKLHESSGWYHWTICELNLHKVI